MGNPLGLSEELFHEDTGQVDGKMGADHYSSGPWEPYLRIKRIQADYDAFY